MQWRHIISSNSNRVGMLFPSMKMRHIENSFGELAKFSETPADVVMITTLDIMHSSFPLNLRYHVTWSTRSHISRRCKNWCICVVTVILDEVKELAVIGNHDDVIKWKHLPRYWPLVRGAFMFPLIFTLNKRLSKQSWGWWFETLLRLLWRHSYVFLLLN